MLDISPENVVDTDAGTVLRVWHGKGDEFRETSVPRDLATTIHTVADVRNVFRSMPLLEISTTHSVSVLTADHPERGGLREHTLDKAGSSPEPARHTGRTRWIRPGGSSRTPSVSLRVLRF
ncbi:hypothetical protein [Natrarchaeobius halalkaliphilus]|uniref:hypothetical protein n=1 Tax=Natrarchaeobius halalkaliphilus TaxID=1679091 RepID=UPI0014051706|nr:hypothetical protein [Natrarchaeobius halalkaliphilus]